MGASSAGTIHVERRGAAAVVWLDNPARCNALSRTMIRDLLALLPELDADPEVGCVVVRGVQGTFCSGLDLTSLGAGAASGGDEHSMVELAERLERAVAGLRTLSVALVEGYAIGAGCQIALCCDIRLVAPTAQFAIPVGRLGLVYPPTSVERLVELVGPSRATLMLATGRRVDAPTAQLWGLATDLVGTSDGVPASGAAAPGSSAPGSSAPGSADVPTPVDADLDAFLADVASGSRLSLAGSLEMVRAISDHGDADTPPLTASPAGDHRHARAAAIYRHWSELSNTFGEHAEALAARDQKRAPEFPWRPRG